MKTLRSVIFLILLAASAGAVQADEQGPFILEMGSWVCDTPEDYDKAVSAQQEGSKSVFQLAKELFDQGSCIYVDDDMLEDIMAPYVSIVEQQGEKSKVWFFVEYYKRIEMLHRQIRQVKYVGWTDHKNLKKHPSAS